jgi:hypothetical protein
MIPSPRPANPTNLEFNMRIPSAPLLSLLILAMALPCSAVARSAKVALRNNSGNKIIIKNATLNDAKWRLKGASTWTTFAKGKAFPAPTGKAFDLEFVGDYGDYPPCFITVSDSEGWATVTGKFKYTGIGVGKWTSYDTPDQIEYTATVSSGDMITLAAR